MNLTYDMIGAYCAGEIRHPQTVMKEMGITYKISTPQSIADSWWFWNCENIPQNIPNFIKELKAKPEDCIGYGLSKEDVELLKK